jgi:hypothetical protein
MDSDKRSAQVERLEVVETGRRYGVSRSLLLRWRRLFCPELKDAPQIVSQANMLAVVDLNMLTAGWFRRWGRKVVAAVSIAAAVVEGAAGLIGNITSITTFLGFSKKEAPFEVEPNIRRNFSEGGQIVTPIIKVEKSSATAARNCKLDAQWDGYSVPLKFPNYGPSFSIPSGRVTRDITVAMLRPQSHPGINNPRIALTCDNVASEEEEFDW